MINSQVYIHPHGSGFVKRGNNTLLHYLVKSNKNNGICFCSRTRDRKKMRKEWVSSHALNACQARKTKGENYTCLPMHTLIISEQHRSMSELGIDRLAYMPSVKHKL